MAEWVAYLHAQGTHVSHPVNGISYFGIFLVILMLGCASWDRWCPYQTPYTTTIPQALWNSITHFSKIRLDFLQAVAAFRQLNLFGLRSHLQLGTFRRLDNTDELMDLRSLCWVLGNAPRGPSLLRVAQHITSICFCSSEGTRRERIMTSPHLFRIHETFWYLVMKIKRISRNNPENANDHVEILQHISIFGSAVICTSPQWTDVLHPLPMSTMTDIFKTSFDKHGPRNAADWKGQSPVLTTLNFWSSEFGWLRNMSISPSTSLLSERGTGCNILLHCHLNHKESVEIIVVSQTFQRPTVALFLRSHSTQVSNKMILCWRNCFIYFFYTLEAVIVGWDLDSLLSKSYQIRLLTVMYSKLSYRKENLLPAIFSDQYSY